MISKERAEKLLLDHLNSPKNLQSRQDRFVVQNFWLTDKKDYWAFHANSEAWVLRGDERAIYVGGAGYLVNRKTAEIEIIGNIYSIETYLEDKYDRQEANGKIYALCFSGDPYDKKAIINLHRFFDCTLTEARMLMREKDQWLQGEKRLLKIIQSAFHQVGIESRIELTNLDIPLPTVPLSFMFESQIIRLVIKRLEI